MTRQPVKAMADVIMTADEKVPDGSAYEIFDPLQTWKSKMVENYRTRELLVKIFDGGKLVYESLRLKISGLIAPRR